MPFLLTQKNVRISKQWRCKKFIFLKNFFSRRVKRPYFIVERLQVVRSDKRKKPDRGPRVGKKKPGGGPVLIMFVFPSFRPEEQLYKAVLADGFNALV